MASADNTRHLRYLLLFGEGGILILRAVLEREIAKCGMTLDEILQTNKGKFNDLMKKQLEKLFPPTGNVFRDTSTWDISLLCTVILKLFRSSLKSDERCSIRAIKALRDDLAHSVSFSRDEQAYIDDRRDLESTLNTLSNGLDRYVHNECQKLIQRCATGSLDIQADTERLRELSRYDEKFSEQFRILSEEVEGISGRVQNVEEKVECIAERVQGQDDLILLLRNMVCENADFHVFQVLRTIMTLRGPSAQLTILGNEAILKVFKTALKRTGGGKDISELVREVTNILDEIERLDSVKVIDARSGSVRISMRCETCSGLLELIKYIQGNTFRKHLLNLVLALEEKFKCVFKICFEVERESLKEILHSLQNSTLFRREVIGADDNHSQQIQATDTLKPENITLYRRQVLGADDNHSQQIQATGTLKPGSETQLFDVDVAEENAALLDEIIDLLERSDREHAEVMMLIGRSGAGKSAMINTIHKVLTGKHYQIAKQGIGKAQSVTLDLRRYDNCGISLKTIKDEDRRHLIEKIFPKLPHIVDCAGLGDTCSPELHEILELLIGGFLPPNRNIVALQSKQKEFGIGCLKRIYPKANPAWTVTKVVFMQSCRDAVPKNLLDCLKGVLNITDPNTLKRKYFAEVFLLITKYDLVVDPTVHLSNISDEDSMTLKDFVDIEDDIAPEFNIVGALDSNRIRWASFNDRIKGDNQYINNIALKFLKRMVEPRPPPPGSAVPVVDVMKSIDLYMFRLKNQLIQFFLRDMPLNITAALFLVGIVFIVAIAVLYKLLSAGV